MLRICIGDFCDLPNTVVMQVVRQSVSTSYITVLQRFGIFFPEEKNINEVERIISNRWLNTLLYVHLGPINVVVFYDPSGKSHLGVGFVLRCFQRLSFPDTATLRCYWRNNRHTVGPVNSVLSY